MSATSTPDVTPQGTLTGKAGIENLMSPVYGLNIRFTGIPFADGSNLLDSANMISSLKEWLLDNICTNFFSTPDTTTIALLVECLMLMVPFKNSKASKPLRTINNLGRAMHTKATCPHHNKDLALFLNVNWTNIFIDMNATPINVHNFEVFGITSLPKPATQPPALPTLPNPATTKTTTTTLNQQFVALFNQQTNILQQQSKLLTNLTPSRTTPQTLHPYILLKFNTVANNQYTFTYTHYFYHTPGQPAIIQTQTSIHCTKCGKSLTPPSWSPASSLSTNAKILPHMPSTNGTQHSKLIVSGMENTVTHTHALTKHDNFPSTFRTKTKNESLIIWDILHIAFSTIPDYIIARMHPHLVEHPTSLITRHLTLQSYQRPCVQQAMLTPILCYSVLHNRIFVMADDSKTVKSMPFTTAIFSQHVCYAIYVFGFVHQDAVLPNLYPTPTKESASLALSPLSAEYRPEIVDASPEFDPEK
eukprot:jgi/Psemu1/9665/gm1.9665_g